MIYDTLKPILQSETVQSAIRSASLVRQAHFAAAIRKEPPTAEFGLKVMDAQSDFMKAIREAFRQIPTVADDLGYHTFLFFGINPVLFEMTVLATYGVETYSQKALEDILASETEPDVDAIIRGEGSALDTLRWLRQVGISFATYLTACRQD